MARNKITLAQGNSASTTLSASVSNTDTSFPLTSDTAFAGEGMVIIDEGLSTEEFAYATGKVGSSLTIPLANRGLEGGSAQAHAAGATVKGILTSAMYNDNAAAIKLVADAAAGTLLKATGAEINTGTEDAKIVTPKAIADSKVSITDKVETLTNKTLTSPKLNEDVVVTTSATELNLIDGLTADAAELNALDGKTGDWTAWSPTTANITVGNGTFLAAYVQIGKIVHCRFRFELGSTSGIGTTPTITLPVTAATGTSRIMAPIYLMDVGTTYYVGMVINDTSASVLSIYVSKADGTYVTAVTTLTSTIPHTWAVNDALVFCLTYQAA